MPDEPAPAPPGGPPRPPARALRLGLLALLFFGSLGVAHASGLLEELSVDRVRAWVAEAGPLGVAGFVVIFAVGELLHVPGLVFVAAAVLAWGRASGYVISLVAAVVSVSVSFAVVRAVGGAALSEIRQPFLRRMLERLDERPLTTVIALRSVFWMAPALNYGLALTRVRFAPYALGSALGLALPLGLAAVFIDAVLPLLE